MRKLIGLALLLPALAWGQFAVGTSTYVPTLGSYGQQDASLGTTTVSGDASFIGVTVGAHPVAALSCSVYAGSSAAGQHVECGIYNDNSGSPGAVLCHNSYAFSGTVAAAWHTISLTGCGALSAAGTYWLFINTDAGGMPVGYDSYVLGTVYSGTVTYGTYPSNPSVTSPGPYAIGEYIATEF